MRNEKIRLQVEKKFPKHSIFYHNEDEHIVEFVVWNEVDRIVIIPTGYKYMYNDNNGYWVDYYYENCLTKNELRIQKIEKLFNIDMFM